MAELRIAGENSIVRATSALTRSARVLVVVVSASLCASLFVAAAASATSEGLSTVILSDTLPGLITTSPGVTNGPLTQSSAKLFGGNSAEVAVLGQKLADGQMSGYLRVWLHQPLNGDAVVIGAFSFQDPSAVASFLSGLESGSHQVGAIEFAVPDLLGATGYSMGPSALGRNADAYSLQFAKGDIAFAVDVESPPGQLTEADAIAIAERQYANAPGAAVAPAVGPTVWSEVGHIVGLALFVIFMVGLIVISVQRRRRKSAVPNAPLPSVVTVGAPVVSASPHFEATPSRVKLDDLPPFVTPPPITPTAEGWYMCRDSYIDQAYWDGQSWTAGKRLSGATWSELPLGHAAEV
jgi:hypothetical protein